MTLIKNIISYPAKTPGAKRAFVMCGFGGSIWQLKRLINRLNRAGYDVTALDFSETVLSSGDPKLLPELVEEVVEFAETEAEKTKGPILLVGVSLDALISLNIIRRSNFDKAVLITGGDIVIVAKRLYGKQVWPQSFEELAALWSAVNMYTKPEALAGKRLLFVLPANDKLIDVSDVRHEVRRQAEAGNKLLLVERRPFGHVGTIILETVLFPGRTLGYIATLAKS